MKCRRRLIFILLAICVVCLASFLPKRTVPAMETEEYSVKLPVLMYHQVLDLPEKMGKYVISPHELEADLRLISELGFETVTVQDLIDFCDGKRKLPEKPVMLTFDDGYQTDYVNVFPLLKKYNMKAVFSVVGSYADKYSQNIDKHINYAHLSWSEIQEMQSSGLCEFQNHSYNMHSLKRRHGCLQISGETDEQYRALMHEDIAVSQELFFTKLGTAPTCFTYPYGGASDTLRRIIRDEKFAASLGTYEQINVLSGDREELYDIRRFNRFHGRDITKILEKAE